MLGEVEGDIKGNLEGGPLGLSLGLADGNKLGDVMGDALGKVEDNERLREVCWERVKATSRATLRAAHYASSEHS